MDYEETKIINKLKAGDREAFRAIFDSYYEALTRYCIRFVQQQDEAEEIVQDAFVNLWEKRKSIQINSSLNAYLYQTIKNRALNLKNHHTVIQKYRDHYIHNTTEALFADELEQGEMLLMYDKAVSNMPEKRRQVYELSRKHGLKYAEIAEQLSVSVKTVEAHLSKALDDLREQLKDYLPMEN